MKRYAMVALIVVAAIAMVFRDNPLNAAAQRYAQSVATTSAATYVTLRTLNAFLSTAQEVEVGFSWGEFKRLLNKLLRGAMVQSSVGTNVDTSAGSCWVGSILWVLV